MKWYKYDTGFPVIDMNVYNYEYDKFMKGKRKNLIEADFYQWDLGFEYAVDVRDVFPYKAGKSGRGAETFSIGLHTGVLSYQPEKNIAWAHDFGEDYTKITCSFFVKNWKEVEKLRYQINRAYHGKDKKNS